MNGVLARMAKQARGEAAEVQPRMTPRFAPVSLGSRGTPMDPQGSQAARTMPAPQIREDSAADLPEIEPLPGERKQADSSGAMHDRAQARRRDEDVKEGETSGTRPRTVESSLMPRMDTQIGEPRRIAEHERESSEFGREQLMVAPRKAGLGSDREQRHSIDGELESRRSPALVEPSAEADPLPRANASDASSELQPRRDLPKESSERPGRRGEAQSEAGLIRRDASRNRRALPEDVAASGEESTEVHISIGHIELRAPRTEAKPQPATFRPRVTLAEFLRRSPEERR